jgi:hypothetical protein
VKDSRLNANEESQAENRTPYALMIIQKSMQTVHVYQHRKQEYIFCIFGGLGREETEKSDHKSSFKYSYGYQYAHSSNVSILLQWTEFRREQGFSKQNRIAPVLVARPCRESI